MGSTRLPGKVMMRIQGKSILERAIRRLSAAPVVDRVAVLTTFLVQDDLVAEEATRLGALVYRGPDQDVLRRFQEASEQFKPDIVIRATADNPLIDIDSINRIVEALRSGSLDLCMENQLPYGAATEACTAEALARSHRLAREPHHREHVTLYIKEHTEAFRVRYLTPPELLRRPDIRVTVDTPEDLDWMDRLIGRLPEGGGVIPLEEYIPLAMSIFKEREVRPKPYPDDIAQRVY